MMTFGDLKAGDVPKRVNLCGADPRFMDLTNSVIERLLNHGNWWGTVKQARFCIHECCITMPREVATLEGITQCDRSSIIQNQWYQYLTNYGLPCSDICGAAGFSYSGTASTFSDVCTPSNLKVYIGNASDAGKRILFQGYDENKIWIRTMDAGEWVDGEYLTLVNQDATTTNKFSSITGVQKDATNKSVRVYAVFGTTEKPIAVYQHDETRPVYQRYRIHNFSRFKRSCGCLSNCTHSSTCSNPIIDGIVKLQYVPVSQDTDFLIIDNLGALRLACMAMKAEWDGNLAKADALWFGNQANQRIGAIPLLNQELRTMTSDRIAINSATQGSARLRYKFAGFI